MEEITLGSLFDGIGGFPYAASFYGIHTLWASEIVPECVSVTRRHFPGMSHVGDITRLHGGELAPVDIITFGSPCQGLSLAGLRRGLADERSGLFMEAVRVINEMKEATDGRYPKFALWENVPGALSSAGGRDYQAVLEAFTKGKVPVPGSGKWADAGMVRGGGADIAWVVYDAQHFGTAQRRRRVFLVADFGGGRAAEILFVPRSLRGYFEAGGTPVQGAAAFAEGGPGGTGGESSGGRCLTGTVYCIAGNTIGRLPWNGGSGAGYQERISYTLTTMDRHAVAAPRGMGMEMPNNLGAGPSAVERDSMKRDGVLCAATGQSHAEILSGLSPTLSCCHEQPYAVYPDGDGSPGGGDRTMAVRRLTPLECERLQGFPDHWTEKGHDGRQVSDSKRYQMLGNSIAVPCVAYIMQGICQALGYGGEPFLPPGLGAASHEN